MFFPLDKNQEYHLSVHQIARFSPPAARFYTCQIHINIHLSIKLSVVVQDLLHL